MSDNSDSETDVFISSVWASPPDGAPVKRRVKRSEHVETVLDGLQVYHNPYADYPLSPEVFKSPRVVQNYVDFKTGMWIYEGRTDALHVRLVERFPKKSTR